MAHALAFRQKVLNGEMAMLIPYLSPDGKGFSDFEWDLWTHFFAGAIIIASKDHKSNAFYNPFIDAWLTAEWGEGGETLLPLYLRPAIMHRISKDAPGWAQKIDVALPAALKTQTEENISFYHSHGKPAWLEDQAKDIILTRLKNTAFSVISVIENDKYNKVLSNFLDYLREGQSRQLENVLTKKRQLSPVERLTALPAAQRSSMRLMTISHANGITTALYASPLMPNNILFLEMSNDKHGRPHIDQAYMLPVRDF
jgi:hypothetical protein